ncbi:MAG: type I-F CRISPR-associated protein Csy1 [Desulfovibrio sp.]|uniref:type I-F CRISPR-associated protein Csy1 n=1 Tax=Desulfovibrio sp. 7SRBS1 TaxID=3378064 RepID=UPI003B3FE5D4
MDEQDTRQRRFKRAMEEFLATLKPEPLSKLYNKQRGDIPKENLKEKLTKEQLLERINLETWLQEFVAVANKMEVRTHTLKGIHSKAKGTNIFCNPASMPCLPVLGSCHLKKGYPLDIARDAGLSSYARFLRVRVEGKTLLDWTKEQNPDLKAALGTNLGPQIFNAVNALWEATPPVSHTLAKQIYWLTGDDPCDDEQYHLLSPLYPSSLAQVVHERLQEDRGSDEAKKARKARSKGEYSSYVIHDYSYLAVLKLGGTKPQNVSQLNAERRGTNYLLDSRPPRWTLRELQPLKGTTSLFTRFGKQRECATLVGKLKRFLESDPPKNMQARNTRDEFIDSIVGEFILYVDRLLRLEPGWTAAPECQLPAVEKLLVDPGRAELDPNFAAERENPDWLDEIAKRFGQWLNSQLRDKLPMGDVETIFWSDEFKEIISYPHSRLVFELDGPKEDRHG